MFLRKILLIIITLTLALSGCKAKTAPVPESGPAVTVSKPIHIQAADHLELVGNTQAINTVQLVARVAGYLDKVFFQDGQIVNKGQLLFLIQQDTYQAKLKQAEGQVTTQKALLEYAQRQLTRYKDLFRNQAAAQADVDNWSYQRDSAEANLKIAEANRDLASLDLSYTQVSAPFTGKIDRRLQDPGNLVGVGENTILAQLTQVDPLYVYFTISDTDLARLMRNRQDLMQNDSQKEKAYIELVGEEGFPHEGYIDFTAPTIVQTSGTTLMRAVIMNPSGNILPGAYARIKVPLEEKTELVVPEEAINNDQLGAYVLIVNKDYIVERRNIKSGFSVDNLRVIEQGLNGDEWVIIRGLIKSTPGHKVSPVKEDIQRQVKK